MDMAEIGDLGRWDTAISRFVLLRFSRAAFPSAFGGRNKILETIRTVFQIIRFYSQIFQFFSVPRSKFFAYYIFLVFGWNLIKSLAEFS